MNVLVSAEGCWHWFGCKLGELQRSGRYLGYGGGCVLIRLAAGKWQVNCV
jgi:hypothetical protein